MGTVTEPRFVVALDDSDDPCDVVDAQAVGNFASGDLPWARTVRMATRADATLLPTGAVIEHEATDSWRSVQLATGDGWSIWIRRHHDRSALVTVFAGSAEIGEPVLAQAIDGAAEPPAPVEDGAPAVRMGFWYMGCRVPERRPRSISAADWPDIRGNYTANVASALDRLIGAEPDDITGRLLLLHGPPGTGKTTALRSLAFAWRSWCQFDYVIDPEKLLTMPGYLMAVALAHPEDDEDEESEDSTARWRLLILEDCDELIRAGAKSNTGQAMARLLNITDGLLGQGLNLIIAISTNEPLVNLHPAVVRPGRCIAQIEVGPLSAAEARRWLGRPAELSPGGATLAELFAKRGEIHTITQRDQPAAAGQYL